MREELVVLVNENNQILGTLPKAIVHGPKTPLHRGFSIFIFNSKGEVLLQQRSKNKQTWPGVWSNSCCGHPGYNEDIILAVSRRLEHELGLKAKDIELISDYRYQFIRDGIMENEICPILVGYSDNYPKLNPNEVENYKYLDWKKFVEIIKENKQDWSEWCREETLILDRDKKFKLWYKNHVQ